MKNISRRDFLRDSLSLGALLLSGCGREEGKDHEPNDAEYMVHIPQYCDHSNDYICEGHFKDSSGKKYRVAIWATDTKTLGVTLRRDGVTITGIDSDYKNDNTWDDIIEEAEETVYLKWHKPELPPIFPVRDISQDQLRGIEALLTDAKESVLKANREKAE